MEDREDNFVYHHDSVTQFITYIEEVIEEGGIGIKNVDISSEDVDGLRDVITDHAVKDLAKKVYEQVRKSLIPGVDLCLRLTELRIKRRKGAVKTLDTGSARLTRQQLLHIYKDLVTSKFTMEEVAKIRRNWDCFTKRYKLNNPLIFISLKQGGTRALLGAKNMYKFKLFLSHGLPPRGLHNVYRKWVSLMCSQKKGKFSNAEECLLKELLPLCEADSRLTRVNILMVALQRSRKAIVTKIKELQSSPLPDVIPAVEVTWTVEREEMLVKELCKELGAESLDRLRLPVSEVEWMAVSKRLGITKKQAYNHWHQHLVPALMATSWITRPDLEKRIIKRLKKMVDRGEVADWRQVNWRTLAEKVGGYGHLYVYRIAMTLRWNFVKIKKLRDDIKESVRILYELGVPKIRERSPKRDRSNNETIVHSPKRDSYLPRATYDFTSHTLCYLKRTLEHHC